MQFDPLDSKFREAAQNHHPAYDEKAWSKMEKLLDKHLPQEERKRRFIYFWILAIALIGGTILLTHPFSGKKPIADETSKTQITPDSKITSAPAKPPVVISQPLPEQLKTADLPANVKIQAVEKPIQAVNLKIGEKKNQDRSGTKTMTNNIPTSEKQIASTVNSHTETVNNKNVVVNKITDNNTRIQEAPVVSIPANKSPDALKNNLTPTPKNNSLSPTSDVAKSAGNSSVIKQDKTKKRKNNEFFFTLGGGPDLSFIKLNSPGTLKLFGGGGIGYTFHGRISLRTGFYSGRKIYSASPEDYNAPANFYIYYPNLQKVNANCQVYEVPLSLSYNFVKNTKHNFFASTGISSYFMRKEEYNYFYKYTPTSPITSREYKIENVNKHWLAGLTLSAGYTQNIGKHFSMTVEPYTKLPLKGVGYGKVKLNSTGVLFSLGIKPFAAKK